MGYFNRTKSAFSKSSRTKVPLPRNPMSIDPNSGFVYPGMAEELRSDAANAFLDDTCDAFLVVKFRGNAILGYHLGCCLNAEQTAVEHYISVTFCPSIFESKMVAERFMGCAFINDFKIDNNYDDQDLGIKGGIYAEAFYGMDVDKAMKVASCILANVCYIPLDAPLMYEWKYWVVHTFESSMKVLTPPASMPVEYKLESDFAYPGMEEAIRAFSEKVFSVKGASGSIRIDAGGVLMAVTVASGDEKNIAVVFEPTPEQARRYVEKYYYAMMNYYGIFITLEDGQDGPQVQGGKWHMVSIAEINSSVAYCGEDAGKAAKIVACLLSGVCGFPLDAVLEYEDIPHCDNKIECHDQAMAEQSDYVYPELKENLIPIVAQVFANVGSSCELEVSNGGYVPIRIYVENFVYGSEVEKNIQLIVCSAHPDGMVDEPPAHLKRFMESPYVKDFTLWYWDARTNYGEDVNEALRVASYILAKVYCYPLDQKFEFDHLFVEAPPVLKESNPQEEQFPTDYGEKDLVIGANGVLFVMKHIDGGTFQMGGTKEKDAPVRVNGPVHTVSLDSYYLGETVVTQALWEAVMGSNQSFFKGGDLPVDQVSWEECQEFIDRLNALTGRRFRLPTEAEWEFAAKGGNKGRGCVYSGSNIIDEVAWCVVQKATPHLVKTKKPNELGLFDMSGSVYEWCNDWFDDYSSNPQVNPQGPANGWVRVMRGGYEPYMCGVSSRMYGFPVYRYFLTGLRLALSELAK